MKTDPRRDALADPFAIDSPVAIRDDAPPLPADIERYVEATRLAELARKGAGAEATLRGYRADWGVFTRWCAERGRSALPSDSTTVAQYIRYLIDRPRRVVREVYERDGKRVERARREGPATSSTVSRHVVSIRKAHVLSGYDDPTLSLQFRNVWKGVRKERGVKPHQKTEIDKHRLLHAVRAIGDEHDGEATALIERKLAGDERDLELRRLRGGQLVELGAARAQQLQRLRDHAILLLGWSGALRRSEVAALDVADVHEEELGLHIDLPRSKTNQEGEEEYVLIHRATDPAFCAVIALERWRAALATLGIVDGRVFRRVDRHGNVLAGGIQGAVVATIVKRSAAAAGLSPDLFGGHSLRSGWISTGVQEDRREDAMMRHSRHLSIKVFRGYVRRAKKWDQHPGLGLL